MGLLVGPPTANRNQIARRRRMNDCLGRLDVVVPAKQVVRVVPLFHTEQAIPCRSGIGPGEKIALGSATADPEKTDCATDVV